MINKMISYTKEKFEDLKLKYSHKIIDGKEMQSRRLELLKLKIAKGFTGIIVLNYIINYINSLLYLFI